MHNGIFRLHYGIFGLHNAISALPYSTSLQHIRKAEAERAAGVFGSLAGHVVDGAAIDLGHALGHAYEVGGLVALSAVRHGRQIRRIGLEHDAVQWHGLGQYFGQAGLLECEHASYAEAEAGVLQQLACLVGRSAEAVEHAAAQAFTLLVEQFEQVGVGLAAMDADGLAQRTGPLQLPAEHAALKFLARIVPIVVEPNLADADVAIRVAPVRLLISNCYILL